MSQDDDKNQPGSPPPPPESPPAAPPPPPEPPSEEESVDAMIDAMAEAVGEKPDTKPGEEPEPKPGEEGEPGEKPGDEGKPEEKPDDKGGADDKDDKGKKGEEADDSVLNDEIPADAPEKTRKRMETLIDRTKTAEQAAETAMRERDEIIGMIEGTGAAPEQFNMSLQYLSLVNSDKPEDLKKAVEFLTQELEAVSAMAGIEAPGVDLLAAHPDLKEKVETGDLDRAYALELAQARRAKKVGEQRDQQVAEQGRVKKQITEARTALNDLETELRGKDPRYDEKRRLLLGPMKRVFAKLPPSEWPKAFREAYDQIELAPAPPAPPPPPAPPRTDRQPLGGGKTPAGQQARQASDPVDAMSQAIENLG